jgi:hypothetical protein
LNRSPVGEAQQLEDQQTFVPPLMDGRIRPMAAGRRMAAERQLMPGAAMNRLFNKLQGTVHALRTLNFLAHLAL